MDKGSLMNRIIVAFLLFISSLFMIGSCEREESSLEKPNLGVNGVIMGGELKEKVRQAPSEVKNRPWPKSRKHRIKGKGSHVELSNLKTSVQNDSPKILRILNSHKSQIRYCSDRELGRNPKQYGIMSVKFSYGGNGLIKDISKLSSTMNNLHNEYCIMKVLKRILFPEPTVETVTVWVDISLSSPSVTKTYEK